MADMVSQAATTYLNDFRFDDKEKPAPPTSKGKNTKFVDEKP